MVGIKRTAGALALLLLGSATALLAQNADAGALVAAVAAGGPAEKAGIARGDIILSVDDKAVGAPADLVQALASRKPGDSVALKISHGDVTRTVTATLEGREDRPYLGVMLAASGPAGNAEAPPVYAAFITEVTPGSPAAQAGLQPRDVVLAVDGTSLDAAHSLGDLIAQHKAGDAVTLSVASRDGQPRDVSATLARSPEGADRAYLGVRYGTVPPRGQGPRMGGPRMEGPRRGPGVL